MWQDNQSDQYVKVIPQSPEDDVESALKSSGREFQCKQFDYTTRQYNKVCYVKVSPTENLQVKLLKTPETLVTDAGNTVKVVGYVLLQLAMLSGYSN